MKITIEEIIKYLLHPILSMRKPRGALNIADTKYVIMIEVPAWVVE